MPSKKEFVKRMEHQLELLALETYSQSAARLGPGKYRELFLGIASQEEHHAELVREVLELLE